MKVCLISLGCAKNLVDSENILGLLRDKGFQIVSRGKGFSLWAALSNVMDTSSERRFQRLTGGWAQVK
ncbi:MAG: hypothetical protein JRJ02_06470 [Deltaproteobacteria bacterium]|nr:hypothetical protein [Deltaproteobacteria bacterium]